MIRFTLNPKTHRRNAAKARRARKGIPKAQARAAREANRAMRKEASKAVQEDLNVKASAIKKTLSHERVTPQNPVASLIAKGNPLALIHFKRTIQTKKGVSVMIRPGTGKKVLPGTFIAQMSNARVGVFLRGKKKVKPGQHLGLKRLPIHQRYNASPVQIIGDHKKRIAKKGREVYQRRLDHHLKRLLRIK